MNGLIYIATNKINGKSYIGQTTRSISRRRSQHYKDAKRGNNYFHNALNKYKKEDFKWNVLYKDIPIEKLNVAEVCAIYIHNTYYEGYNSTTGGENGKIISEETKKKISKANSGKKSGKNNAMFGKKHSKETRKKISESNLGRKVSEETKKKLSIANTGKKISLETKIKTSNSLKGRKFSKEHKQNISIGSKGRKVSEETRNKISRSLGAKEFSVFVGDVFIGRWQNATKCSKDLGDISRQMISYCLSGKGISKKYTFELCEEKT